MTYETSVNVLKKGRGRTFTDVLESFFFPLYYQKYWEFSKKNLSTIKNFQKLVKDNGDNGLRTISSILGEKSLNSFKVKKSEFKTSEKLVNDELKNAILVAYSNIKKYHE